MIIVAHGKTTRKYSGNLLGFYQYENRCKQKNENKILYLQSKIASMI